MLVPLAGGPVAKPRNISVVPLHRNSVVMENRKAGRKEASKKRVELAPCDRNGPEETVVAAPSEFTAPVAPSQEVRFALLRVDG